MTPAQRRHKLARSGERLVRLAYDLEELASRLRRDGEQGFADGVKALSSRSGDVGRTMISKAEGMPD